MGTKSHLLQLYPVIEKLLDNGHKVTGIYFYSAKIKHENFTEILIENPFEEKMAEISKMVMEEGGTSVVNFKIWKASWAAWSEVIEDMSMLAWRHPEISQLINTDRKFDAVMTLGLDAYLADVFNCSLITWSPAGPVPMFMTGSGNVINLSVQPMIMTKYIEPMTFLQRVGNHLLHLVSDVWVRVMLYKMNGVRTRELGYELRSEAEVMEERFSVFISNHHPVTHGSWPYLPNVVEVGGLGVKEARPLTGDLRTFLDSASAGAVYVSFGSAIKSSQIREDRLEQLLVVFRSLPQYSFVWKWDGEIENLPDKMTGAFKSRNFKIPQWEQQKYVKRFICLFRNVIQTFTGNCIETSTPLQEIRSMGLSECNVIHKIPYSISFLQPSCQFSVGPFPFSVRHSLFSFSSPSLQIHCSCFQRVVPFSR